LNYQRALARKKILEPGVNRPGRDTWLASVTGGGSENAVCTTKGGVVGCKRESLYCGKLQLDLGWLNLRRGGTKR